MKLTRSEAKQAVSTLAHITRDSYSRVDCYPYKNGRKVVFYDFTGTKQDIKKYTTDLVKSALAESYDIELEASVSDQNRRNLVVTLQHKTIKETTLSVVNKQCTQVLLMDMLLSYLKNNNMSLDSQLGDLGSAKDLILAINVNTISFDKALSIIEQCGRKFNIA